MLPDKLLLPVIVNDPKYSIATVGGLMSNRSGVVATGA